MELEIGDIKNGEFNFKLEYYVYQVEKGSLSETITIEINVTFNKSDFENWPTYDPAESLEKTVRAMFVMAAVISIGVVVASSSPVTGVAATFLALATNFLTNNKV